MSVITERILPKEVNTDLSSLYLGNDKARFIRGIDYALYGDGSEMVYKPEESNRLYDSAFIPPAGENFAIGRKVSEVTNEVYVLAYNSNNNHFIYRIKDGRCQYVYRGPELNFQLDPLHFIHTGRIEVVIQRVGEKRKTFLIWTDNHDDQHHLCVDDSIATDSFNPNLFPYFQTKYPKREYTLLGLRAFTDSIQIKEIAGTGKGLNRLKYKTWKFRLSGYDVYGRRLEQGKTSTVFYLNDCANDNADCLDLTFDLLSPLVDKFEIEFSNDCGVNWKRHVLINKYDECKGEYWQRQFNKTLAVKDNKITYRFCPGEQCSAVAPEETKRNYNPLPFRSNSVLRLGSELGLAGNEYGKKPFSCDAMDRVRFSVENPSADTLSSVTVINRTIVVWMVIYNTYVEESQGIWRQDDKNVWGGLATDGRIEDRVGGKYNQRFGDPDQEGFIGYLSDGSVTVSKQYKYKYDSPPFVADAPNRATAEDWTYWGVAQSADEVRGAWLLQRFEFKNVRPGVKIFRVAGHQSTLHDNFKRTSTYASGYVKFWGHLPNLGGQTWTDSRELVIDVCNNDYDGMKDNQVFEILDGTSPRHKVEFGRETRVSSGYITEAEDNGKGVNPVAFVPITMNLSGDADALWTNHTDYNGFWFSFARDKDHEVAAWIMRNCGREKIGLVDWNKNDGSGVKTFDLVITSRYVDYEKEPCNRILLKGRIVDCEQGKGLPGVPVSLTNGQNVVTDTDGNYMLITYDWERQRNEQQVTHNDKVIVSPSGRCVLVNCDGALCIPTMNFTRPACSVCKERVVTLPDVKLKFVNIGRRGLQLGGRYPFGIGGADWMDRKGFVQSKKEWALDIPTVNDMGAFGFPRIKWEIPSDVTFDPWIERIYFYWGQNVKYTDFHSWVVDRFEFIDGTGNKNEVAPTQIRIYYTSLNEYNKQYNFSTNSTWQVIDQNDSLIITDTVHFIANGNYEIFPKNITALVRSDKQGQYFQIDYTSDLQDLKEGALFKFMREPECALTQTFREAYETVEVVNGKAVKNFGYLDVFDSYFVSREIPTPLVQTKKVQKAVANSSPVTYEEVDEEESVNVLKTYGWPFEHHSPSDFWGKPCGNFGRVNVKNDLEDIFIKATEIALSGSGANPNANYLHYFDEERVKDFGKEYESITAALVRENNVVCICSTKTFVAAYDSTTAKSGADGVVRVLSGEKKFSNAQNVLLFGCREQDRNVIATNGDIIMWVDGNKSALIKHNFNSGENIEKGRFKSALRRKIKAIDRNHKNQGKILSYLHGEINPKNDNYTFTDFKIDLPSYINNIYAASFEKSETFCVDIQTSTLRKFAHYTPEMFAYLSGEETDEQFFSFKNALPYSHYNNASSYLSFFGVQCQPMIRVCMATDPLLYKNYLSVVLHASDIAMYGEEVVTYNKQQSFIPRNYFRRVNKYWIAPFLCDEKTVGKETKKLTNGEKLRGKGVELLLVGDPDNSDKYFELTAIEIIAIKS
jgi:hypothetical protein